DAVGLRVGKKINGTLVQGWLWESRLRIAAELDGSGNLVSRFAYARSANSPAFMIRGGATYRVLKDDLESTRLVVDTSNGKVIDQTTRDDYGNTLADSNAGFTPIGFAGGLYDRDTRLVRFGRRDYDPEIGRWIAKDPIGFAGGDTGLYGYVAQDPIN